MARCDKAEKPHRFHEKPVKEKAPVAAAPGPRAPRKETKEAAQ
jgi:hypothetical protein